MGFTNSSLVSYTRISPNRNSPRNKPITKITIHHMAGVMSVEGFGNIVANPARQMSANYAIGNDGRIGLFCPESDRSWCSSSALNDHAAITIEVSNSAYGDASGWPVGPAAYNSLIKLCVDICKRNGIKKLYYDGTPNGSLTRHCDLASTLCPGPWIKAHTQEICDKVNAQLGTEENTNTFKTYTVKLKSTEPVYDSPGGKQTATVGAGNVFTIVDEKTVNNCKYGKLKSGKGWVILEKKDDKSYTVTLKSTDLVYASAGGNQTGTVGANGVFTIVEDKKVGYITYGKLKSGKGWVIVKNETPKPTAPAYKTGDLVSLTSNAVYYNGGGIPEWVKHKKWYISSISGSRAILGKSEDGSFNIQSAIDTKYLNKASKTQSLDIKKGDKVKVVNNIIYGTNNRFTVYASFYYVLEVSGDRLVISSDGRNVTTAIAKKNVQKI